MDNGSEYKWEEMMDAFRLFYVMVKGLSQDRVHRVPGSALRWRTPVSLVRMTEAAAAQIIALNAVRQSRDRHRL